MIARTLQHDVIDALCWRHYGYTEGTVEAVLEANPWLANYEPIVPMGLEVQMPDLIPASSARLINLFD